MTKREEKRRQWPVVFWPPPEGDPVFDFAGAAKEMSDAIMRSVGVPAHLLTGEGGSYASLTTKEKR